MAARDVTALAGLSQPAHPRLGPVTLQVTMIEGGVRPNVIPPECTLEIDARTIPELDNRALLAQVREVVESEVELVRELVVETAEQVITEYGEGPHYQIGVMLELPRACLLAGELAHHCDFFSFGTNDLTQLVYGVSRDDMGKFFPDYQREGLMPESPLAVFDTEGVGQLVRTATERGRATRAQLPLGVCGEHGGDPVGVRFFHEIGLNYVSCSPFRVPVARLAAAHAALGIER